MKAEYISHMGNDLTVVNAARVSFDKQTDVLQEADIKLIKYLANNKHWTPFSHPSITLRIKAPIFVRTQLFKHKVGFTENEVSRRYVDKDPEFFFPILRKRHENLKQGSRDEFPDNLEACEAVLLRAQQHSFFCYKILLAEGVCPEQARMVLPQNMYTEWFWTGSLAAFARMCKQRLDPHAQQETREIAQQIADIIKPLFPHSWSSLVAE